jgi:hypothetical protein
MKLIERFIDWGCENPKKALKYLMWISWAIVLPCSFIPDDVTRFFSIMLASLTGFTLGAIAGMSQAAKDWLK